MTKKMVLLVLCCACIGLAACGSENDSSNESVAATQAEQSSVSTEETSSEQIEDSSSEQTEDSSAAQTEDSSVAQTDDTSSEQPDSSSDAITEEQALEAIKNYCFNSNPDLSSMVDTDEYNIKWEVSTNDAGQIVVLYVSYTSSQSRYYIDPVSGDTYVTELVPGIIDEEQRTEESFNIKDYLK